MLRIFLRLMCRPLPPLPFVEHSRPIAGTLTANAPVRAPGRFGPVALTIALLATPIAAVPSPDDYVVSMQDSVHAQRIELVRAAYRLTVGETSSFRASRVGTLSTSDRVRLPEAFFATRESRRAAAAFILTNRRFARLILRAYYGIP